MRSEIAAMTADGVKFSDVFGDGKQVRHGAERTSPEIHIQAGYNDPKSPQSQFFADIFQLQVKKLGLIYPDHLDIIGNG